MTSNCQPLVSFVVPTYNVARFLPDCLNSILSQTATDDFEVILVDDASTDDTERVARSFTDPRIQYIRHPVNMGHVVTINEGFARARGAYIARIDSDDRYRSEYLASVLPILRMYPEVGAVFSDASIIDENGQTLQDRCHWTYKNHDFKGNVFFDIIENNFIPAATLMARREAWQAALPIPDGLGFSDWYLNLGMARKFEFYYVNKPLADYRLHGGNLHSHMTRDGSEERTVFRILNEIFSEDSGVLMKKSIRRRIYGQAYLQLADKYFGHRMNADARRCYLAAVRHNPKYIAHAGLARRLFGTYIGRHAYDGGKSILKSLHSDLMVGGR